MLSRLLGLQEWSSGKSSGLEIEICILFEAVGYDGIPEGCWGRQRRGMRTEPVDTFRIWAEKGESAEEIEKDS